MGKFPKYVLLLKEKNVFWGEMCFQLIGVVCVTTGLHVCSLEWLDHPRVPLPCSAASLLELPHFQVIIPSYSFVCGECALTFTCVCSHDALLSGVGEFSGASCLRSPSPWWGRKPLNPRRSGDSCWCLGLRCFQELPKEDLTVSEKFQLVLDVAQRAQVRRGGRAQALFHTWPRRWPELHRSCFQFPLSESVWEAGKHPGENKEVSLSARAHTFLKRWLWCLLNSACVCVQFVHVGSAWIDSEAVCGGVGGLHLLLPAAIQTAGLHHRYIRHSLTNELTNSHTLNVIQADFLVLVHNFHCRERLISIFFLLSHVCWYKVLHHRLYLQEVPQAEAALRHPICHLDQFTYKRAAEGA